ncbi:MAG: amidohydrolase family protein, partial [Acidobacteriota bacterium]
SVGPGMEPPFFQLWQAITRKYNGKVWQPDQRINRVHALKMWTSWAADYVTKPDKIGSLEVGKFADLLIIDRDYFTIEVDDILRIRPLMTMLGGEIVVLQESLAQDVGMQAVGPVYGFTDAQVEHIGQPFLQ